MSFIICVFNSDESPLPVNGKKAKWMGELGSVARGIKSLWQKSQRTDGCVGDILHTPPREKKTKQKHFN